MDIRIIKVGRRDDAHSIFSHVQVGQSICGTLYLPTKKLMKKYDNPDSEKELSLNEYWEEAVDPEYAKIGYPIYITGSGNWMQTSRIVSYFKKNSDNDKLILPKNFDRKHLDNLDMTNLTDNHIVFLTMNSIYIAEILEDKCGLQNEALIKYMQLLKFIKKIQ